MISSCEFLVTDLNDKFTLLAKVRSLEHRECSMNSNVSDRMQLSLTPSLLPTGGWWGYSMTQDMAGKQIICGPSKSKIANVHSRSQYSEHYRTIAHVSSNINVLLLYIVLTVLQVLFLSRLRTHLPRINLSQKLFVMDK
jgi:hypothetical protein